MSDPRSPSLWHWAEGEPPLALTTRRQAGSTGDTSEILEATVVLGDTRASYGLTLARASHMPGQGVITLADGRRQPFEVVREANGTVWVWLAGRTLRLTPHTSPALSAARRHAAGCVADGPVAITAPMPGLIRQTPVAVGQSVASGQTLMLMESMKMELSLTAPCAGRLTVLAVTVGQSVEQGMLLMAITPDGDAVNEAVDEAASS